jgi:hypothetical protein
MRHSPIHRLVVVAFSADKKTCNLTSVSALNRCGFTAAQVGNEVRSVSGRIRLDFSNRMQSMPRVLFVHKPVLTAMLRNMQPRQCCRAWGELIKHIYLSAL